MDRTLIGMCGAYCGACDWKEKMGCAGCQTAAGKPFWGECAVARCAIGKGLEHCGLCAGVPCDTLRGFFGDPEHGDRGERLANLHGWAQGKDSFLVLRSKKGA